MNEKKFVIKNLTELITLKPLADQGRFIGIKSSDLGRLNNAWIAVDDGKISGIGSSQLPAEFKNHQQLDFKGCIALPGLIDAHTHPVFSGVRADEFCMRLEGATYEDIAKKGGGIQSSVTRTAASDEQELETLIQNRLKTSASHGVTTVEMKSGYGLSIAEELRHLRVIQRVRKTALQTISPTCLALHAVPKDQKSPKAWADLCAEKLLPTVKSENLADAVDAFVEAGYFLPEDCELYLQTAKRLGLHVRLHADEFSNSKAAACAARFQALSADHLQHADLDGIKAMAGSGVVALLLPGTSLYTAIPYTDSRPFKEAGCPVGLATDFNPGSCPIDNLRLIMTVGALHCKLTMPEAIAAVTWVPARSLRLENSKGALTVGRDADILVMPLSSCEEFMADLGRTKPRAVFARGSQLI